MCERERTPEQAQEQFLQALESLGCFCRMESTGTLPVVTYHCSIFCKKSQKLLSKGSGKGLGVQSQLSAQFEALEHLLCQPNKSKNYQNISLNQVDREQIPVLSSALYAEFKEKDFEGRDVPLPWSSYTLFGNPEEKALLPLVQTHPFYVFEPLEGDRFDYAKLYHKTTSNGLASGCTFNEAMIHALLEIIERHSTSIFLVETFLKKNPSQVRLLDHATLPLYLSQIVKEIETTHRGQVLIVEMPNRFGIPSYGCMIELEGVLWQGFGASLNRAYAIERSLLEMMQSYHLKKPKKNEGKERIVRDNPHLKPCTQCDVPWALQKQEPLRVPYEETPIPEGTENYLKAIVDRLKKESFAVYYNEIYADQNVHALHVVVPEAETFFLIDVGILTPLKSHAKAILLK